jgi:hypothetical protein
VFLLSFQGQHSRHIDNFFHVNTTEIASERKVTFSSAMQNPTLIDPDLGSYSRASFVTETLCAETCPSSVNSGAGTSLATLDSIDEAADAVPQQKQSIAEKEVSASAVANASDGVSLLDTALSPIKTSLSRFRLPGKKTKLRSAAELNVLPGFDESELGGKDDEYSSAELVRTKPSPFQPRKYPSKNASLRRAKSMAEAQAEENKEAGTAEGPGSPLPHAHKKKKQHQRHGLQRDKNTEQALEVSICRLTLDAV